MLELNLTPFPELTTERLLLRQLRMEDAEEIFLLRSDEKVNELVDRVTATSIEDAYQYISVKSSRPKITASRCNGSSP